MNINPWVLVPCSNARVDELRTLCSSLAHPADRVVVVTTDRDPVLRDDIKDIARWVLQVPWTGMYISKWWNVGFDFIYTCTYRESPYEVLVINSDATGDKSSVAILAYELRRNKLIMIGPDWHNLITSGTSLILDDERTVWRRVPGACFMVAGEIGLRCDERFRWHYSDDDLEMQARKYGDVALITDTGLIHTTDHELNDEQLIHAEEDRTYFVEKWQRDPW